MKLKEFDRKAPHKEQHSQQQGEIEEITVATASENLYKPFFGINID